MFLILVFLVFQYRKSPFCDIPTETVTDSNTATEEVSKEDDAVGLDSANKTIPGKDETPDGELQTNNDDIDNADDFGMSLEIVREVLSSLNDVLYGEECSDSSVSS